MVDSGQSQAMKLPSIKEVEGWARWPVWMTEKSKFSCPCRTWQHDPSVAVCRMVTLSTFSWITLLQNMPLTGVLFQTLIITHGPIARPEESYQLWCVTVCDIGTSRMRRPWPALGCCARGKNNHQSAEYEIRRCITVCPQHPSTGR
jgi:hypothetical protein